MTKSTGSRHSNVPRAHAKERGLSTFDGTFPGATIRLTAGEAGVAGSVVYQSDDLLALLASNDNEDSSEIIGIATQGFAAGRVVNIQYSGPLTIQSWSWTAGAKVYVGVDGALTQTEPASGYVMPIGVAISPKTILIKIGGGDAIDITYDNASSGLAADNAQAAIDEIDSTIDGFGDVVSFDSADFATAAQGVKADSAIQAADLHAVATSGDYDDLSNLPTLGSAAATDSTAYATSAQGALADSATQPGDLAGVATSGDYDDLTGKPSIDIAIVSPDTSTSHAATSGDNDGFLIFNSASDCTVTLPQTTTEALGAGYHLRALNKGGGNLKVLLEGSDTLDGVSLWFNPAHAVTIIKEAAGSPNAYRLIGNNWLPSAVEDDALTAPPSTPAVGAVYVVAAAATGDWAGMEDMFAIHIGADVYEFASPAGVVYEKTSAVFVGWTGTNWAAV
ncbi:MAG: hypothetical protein ACJA1I_000512 [Zhongshania marina]|jgi:hypothetical protein